MEFTIKGKPVGKARPRVTKNGVYTPQKTKDKQKQIQAEYIKQGNVHYGDNSLKFTGIVEYAIPKSTTKAIKQQMLEGDIVPRVKPDIDNVAKLIMDALNGIAYKDDSQIAEIHLIKKYSLEPKTTIRIEEINANNK